MALILQHLRTSPIPTINPQRPLLPGAPPPSHLPLNPILYLTLAIDSVAPLMRIRSQRGAAGGGVALQIPVPLGLRQRRRQPCSGLWVPHRGGRTQVVERAVLPNGSRKNLLPWCKAQAASGTGVMQFTNLVSLLEPILSSQGRGSKGIGQYSWHLRFSYPVQRR